MPCSKKKDFYHLQTGEEIVNAAEREVLEETSVRAKFKQMVCFRHVHNFNFGCSDMYFIVALTPEPDQDVLKKCDREIDAVEWMHVSAIISNFLTAFFKYVILYCTQSSLCFQVDDYLTHPHVHSTNRFFVQKFLEYEASGVSLTYHNDTHPILKKPYLIYSLDLGPHKPENVHHADPQTNKL